jgi:hypothetical protein
MENELLGYVLGLCRQYNFARFGGEWSITAHSSTANFLGAVESSAKGSPSISALMSNYNCLSGCSFCRGRGKLPLGASRLLQLLSEYPSTTLQDINFHKNLCS